MEVYSAGVIDHTRKLSLTPMSTTSTYTTPNIHRSTDTHTYPQIHTYPHISTHNHTHIHTLPLTHTYSLYSSLFLPPFPSLNIRSTDSAHHGSRSGNDSYNAADNDRPERGDVAYPRPGRQSTVLGPAAEM